MRTATLILALAALLTALLSIGACDSAERVVASVACRTQCEDAETCGNSGCYDRCLALAGDETALGECVGCLQLAAENCDLISGCLSSVCSADALENWECATFCATYGQQCDAAYDCMGACTAWDEEQRNICLECTALHGYCEAFGGGECASDCGGATAQ